MFADITVEGSPVFKSLWDYTSYSLVLSSIRHVSGSGVYTCQHTDSPWTLVRRPTPLELAYCRPAVEQRPSSIGCDLGRPALGTISLCSATLFGATVHVACVSSEVFLSPLLPRSPLTLSLGIDLCREGVFKAKRHQVHGEDPDGQQETGRFAIDQRRAEEAHGGAIVHGGVHEVEREARDHMIHQDPEVIAQERAGDAELPRRRDHQDVARRDERIAGKGGDITEQGGVCRLMTEGTLVEEVADESQTEDGEGEGVACCLRATAEEACEDLVVVF